MFAKEITGRIGEDLPRSDYFDGIVNLNTIKNNFPLFDHLAFHNGELYIFSTKARSRYGSNGKMNTDYNILPNHSERKFKEACRLLKEHNYDISNAKLCFLIAPIENEKDIIYYWGEFSEIKQEYMPKRLRVSVRDTKLNSYKIFGKHTWEYIISKYG